MAETNEAPVVERKGIRPLILDSSNLTSNNEVVVEEGDGVFDEKAPATTKKDAKVDEAAPVVRDYSRFKQYAGKDIANDDELEEEVKTYKTQAERRETIVKGDTELQGNEDYKFFRNLLTATPKQKVTAKLVSKYIDGGYNEAQALEKAKAKIESKKTDPDWLEDEALNVTTDVRNRIKALETDAVNKVAAAKKDLTFVDPGNDFEKTVKEFQPKITDFLVMKLSKDEKQREKLVSEAYIEPKQLNELLKDPEFYNKVCLLKKYEKQWTANVESRSNGKSKLLESAKRTPSIGSGLNKVNNGAQAKPGGFPQITGRLGRKTS